MENLKIVLVSVVVIIGMIFILNWSSKHDEQVMEAGDRYQKCVEDQYRTSPASYYQENGEYPECK